jgi:succinyl-diaminopimelate desuccinylase
MLARYLHSQREAMVRLTRELVAIATENPPGSSVLYQRCRKLLTTHLHILGFHVETHGDCVLAFVGSGRDTLYFHGHYDVVPAQHHAQFRPVRKGANLFGRGSSDMKSGLVAMIYAAKALVDCRIPLPGRIGLVFVPDEETAGPRGSMFLLEKDLLGRNGIGMLTAEPTGGVIWNANHGAISLRVTVPGKTAHVSLQHQGINAFDRAFDVVARLRALKRQVERRAGSILMLGGRAEGGANFNAVPDFFSFTIDRRITPNEDLQTEKKRLMTFLKGCRVEVLQEGNASQTPTNGRLARALAASVKQVTGKPAKFAACGGLLETRFYAEQGIPAFAYGPGLLTVSHGPNEFVPVANIWKCAAVYALTAAHYDRRTT